jgi:hypothetical protein
MATIFCVRCLHSTRMIREKHYRASKALTSIADNVTMTGRRTTAHELNTEGVLFYKIWNGHAIPLRTQEGPSDTAAIGEHLSAV